MEGDCGGHPRLYSTVRREALSHGVVSPPRPAGTPWHRLRGGWRRIRFRIAAPRTLVAAVLSLSQVGGDWYW